MAEVGVVGAGTMGAGIAESAALAGMSVVMLDVGEDALARGRQTIEKDLDRRVKKGRISEAERAGILGRVTPTTSMGDLAGIPLVVEAVVEDMDLKKKVFADLEGVVGEDAVLASNTSSLSVAGIATGVSRPERVVGMHFFNPVPAMKLVEVVSGPSTSPEAVRRTEEVSERLGKTPIRVSDTPGFVVNRVARPFYLEALRIVEAGGKPGAVDAALRGAGFRMGPLELADLIGMDVNLAVSESLFERYYFQPRFRPSFLQRSMVEAGTLGRKSGRGFYDYGGEGQREAEAEEGDEAIALRVISCIVNEAFLALSEGVATAEDIDRAMKLGANYPKGPFEWAEEFGAGAIVRTLDGLREIHGDAYLAAPSLRERAASA
ncbi:3-hydroxybutyryl-CoA dehydrogenase [Rubrobacter marinus]|uniref:3-hydroxybutyryl-CoA dehydrogenase n=1 Tax=Rubrobacter marinus TaxID=2653852 RepID=A0A6G8PX30_9ACTN|nr:3-hydroxyacyl-CoA dehydrogenase NAD-binding domain-containing protein [Rubrobacter marinus]QIN78753.1 3-hydroxybutyryl-CoA dehydrogenase [Rubrobacter marinus]